MTCTSSLVSAEIISSHIVEYRKLMDTLIYEKPGVNVQNKKEKTIALAMKILKIGYPGDKRNEDFEIEVKKQIEEICNLKVGRKLIKGLAKILAAPKIQGKHVREYISVRFGDQWEVACYTDKYKYVCVTTSDYQGCKYHVSKNNVPSISKMPAFIVLAHELIHALHDFSGNKLIENIDSHPLVLESMSNREEQHTITGYDYHIFTIKGKSLDKLDVICENAFILASGLLARTSHQEITDDIPYLEEKVPQNDSKIIVESYYEWLESRLKQVSFSN